MSINITLCDDECAEVIYLATLVRKWAAERGVDVRLSDYESAESFLFAYEDDKMVDILLLDIQMKSIDGVELARQIRKHNETMQIIFITGYPDFIAEGYDVSALHYLMKPVNGDKLFKVLDKAAERSKKVERILLVHKNRKPIIFGFLFFIITVYWLSFIILIIVLLTSIWNLLRRAGLITKQGERR